ncbi:reverse transcriptase domain-containing protein [Nostoc edaphicum]|uniref:reverse transcriptase domain-containing protein n=1 Tax=Nostoc edaphicum TaxID=264686 RepID=UPI002151B36F|nr:reverse transcriptase domain-containing protein [Nostoc edaphicum]
MRLKGYIQCQKANSTKKWVVDADIEGCFDNISHVPLINAIGNFPARKLIQQWLNAGYMDKGVFHNTNAGVPQGGIISPLLANIALHGMESVLGIKYDKKRSYDWRSRYCALCR